MCVRSDHHQWLNSVDAERTAAVSVSGVMAVHNASMASRSAFSVAGWLLSINFILQGSP
jgi:hypothetical protein